VTEGRSRETLWNGLALVAVALAIVGVITRPFLFEPLAGLCLLVSAKGTASRRFTGPGIAVITVCAVLGAGIAVAYSRALY
jgi:hypothetical protein